MFTPKRIVVSKLLSGRYRPGSRPVSWDERLTGVDEVLTTENQTVRLISNGGQSVPAPGWELLLTSERQGAEGIAYEWTLYGLKPGTAPYSMDRL